MSTYANCTLLVSYINVKVINLEATEEKILMFCTFHILDSLGDYLWHGNWNAISGFLWRGGEEVSASSEENLWRKSLLCRNIFSQRVIIEMSPNHLSRLQIFKYFCIIILMLLLTFTVLFLWLVLNMQRNHATCLTLFSVVVYGLSIPSFILWLLKNPQEIWLAGEGAYERGLGLMRGSGLLSVIPFK